MKLTLDRQTDDGKATIGNLHINGSWECYTLEDTYRAEKVAGVTRIPAGTFEIKLRKEGGFHQRYSRYPFHKGMLHLQDVPGFEYILIHKGNFAKNTEGCILVGRGKALADSMITSSELAYRALYPKVADALEAGEKVTITITDMDRDGVATE